MSWIEYNDEYLYEAYLIDQPNLINDDNTIDPFWEEVKTKESKEVYKENYYFRDNLQIPYVTKTLAKGAVRDKIVEFVAKFMDDNMYALSAPGPIYSFTFGNSETSVLYDTFGVTADQLLEMYNNMINETYYGSISSFMTGWVKNAPHKILLMAILIEAIQRGYDDIIECCEYMWAFTEYPIMYNKFWELGVKEDVMIYTIEHLSTKFKVRKVKNLRELIKYDAHSSVSSRMDKLKTGADNEYMDFMYRMRNQIKNTMKNISRAYYNNITTNATQHTNQSVFDDGTIAEQEGHNTNMSQIIDNTINKFITGEINASIAGAMANGSSVDKGNLIGYLNQIKSVKDNKIPRFIENIITAYFNKYPSNNNVNDTEFINFGLALFRSIGTSNDPIYQEIRSILDYWMYSIINIKSQYNREGTWTNYTRAVYNYFIFMINYYN